MTTRSYEDAPGCDSLRDRVIVVTGGAGGIGAAICKRLDHLGACLVVAGRNTAKLERVVETLSQSAVFGGCDLRNAEHAEKLVEFTIARFGRIDAIVNCVGIGRAANAGPISSDAVAAFDERAWDEVLDTNLRGLFHLCRAVAPVMIAYQAGQILDISSARAGRRGQAFGAAYCASKMAGVAMMQAFEAELSRHGVRVVSILPDAVDTELIAGTGLANRGAIRPDSLAEHVAGVLATPYEVTLPQPVVLPHPSATTSEPTCKP